jgi:hypothetical protein
VTSAVVLPFKQPLSTEEAWERYCELVTERHEKDLWKDLEHNMRLARAWDVWAGLLIEQERAQ